MALSYHPSYWALREAESRSFPSFWTCAWRRPPGWMAGGTLARWALRPGQADSATGSAKQLLIGRPCSWPRPFPPVPRAWRQAMRFVKDILVASYFWLLWQVQERIHMNTLLRPPTHPAISGGCLFLQRPGGCFFADQVRVVVARIAQDRVKVVVRVTVHVRERGQHLARRHYVLRRLGGASALELRRWVRRHLASIFRGRWAMLITLKNTILKPL